MKKKTLIYLILIVGICAIAYALFFKKDKTNASENGNKPKSTLLTAEGLIVSPTEFDNVLSLSGTIDADEKLEVRSEVSGRVDKIFFNEGQRIAQGQVLVKINDIELQAQLKQMQTNNQLTSENERRAKLLLAKGAISQEEYDIASAAYKTSLSQTQLIEAQIFKTTIRAPFSGTIGLRNISPGAIISPTTLITNLVKDNKIKITFSVPEKYASQLKTNSKIEFTVANNARTFQGNIYAIEPEIALNTRTMTVRATAQNPEGKLIAGSYANVLLPLNDSVTAISIPSQAIVPVQDGKNVFIIENGKAKQVEVKTGSRTDKDIVVLSGLKAGDTVLTTGVLTLKDGAEVKVTLKK
ncbi:efflux RND transporter periplasmic adaptor subunit [Sphingobacterium spiritivorum]|uniref:efflux RND transporter periplasmic adaptor subunit n=1 Tax=Sphingobacterium spiritivorum TaxID=258 RepID=UPI003DA34CAF